MQPQTWKYNRPFLLESDNVLSGLEVAYCTYGKLNEEKDNVIWICHALTANADAADWWPGMIGEGLAFDTKKYFIVCPNVLGSCYGTTGPVSVNPVTGRKYGSKFPMITVRDMANMHKILAQHLEIKKIKLLIGGSLGGQQAMELAIQQPNLVENLVLLATNARHSAWGIAFNEAQRMALESGKNGLEAARAIAMLSYRNYFMYERTQTDDDEKSDNFKASSYQRHQGEKLKKRFDADSYWLLSKAMDSHNVARGRKSAKQALSRIKANTLVIGILTDLLYPIQEQRYLAEHILNAALVEIDSPFGHDGFLTEVKQISRLIKEKVLTNETVSRNKSKLEKL
jgi:homoserine O-acetyltransferase